VVPTPTFSPLSDIYPADISVRVDLWTMSPTFK
jgi:hypothetical protein